MHEDRDAEEARRLMEHDGGLDDVPGWVDERDVLYWNVPHAPPPRRYPVRQGAV